MQTLLKPGVTVKLHSKVKTQEVTDNRRFKFHKLLYRMSVPTLFATFITTLVLAASPVAPQRIGPHNGGNEFFIGFFENFSPGQGAIFLSVSTSEVVSVAYEVRVLGKLLQSGEVVPGEVDTVSLPCSLVVSSSNEQYKGIHVKTIDPRATIVIYGFNEQRVSTDGFLALPARPYSDVDSYTYYAISTDSARRDREAEVLIVATEDNTEVTITTSQYVIDGVNNFLRNVPKTIILKRLDTFLLKAASDLSGTKIESNKPLSVFSGQKCADVPKDRGFCDILVEQIPPVESWGNAFVTVPLSSRLYYDVFQFHGAEDGTEVNVLCNTASGSKTRTIAFTLKAGGKVSQNIQSNEYCWIEASKRIFVLQLSVGGSVDNVDADPFMMIVPAINQYTSKYTFATGQSDTREYTDFVNLVVSENSFQLDEIFLDDQPLSSLNLNWVSVYAKDSDKPEAYATQLKLTPGVHTLAHTRPLANLGVTVYGFAGFSSYGYVGGLGLGHVGTIDPLLTTITEVTEDAITVDWKSPFVRHTQSIRYKVTVSLAIDQPDDSELSIGEIIAEVDTDETESKLSGLDPDTEYFVTVAAYVGSDEEPLQPVVPIQVRTEESSTPAPSVLATASPDPVAPPKCGQPIILDVKPILVYGKILPFVRWTIATDPCNGVILDIVEQQVVYQLLDKEEGTNDHEKLHFLSTGPRTSNYLIYGLEERQAFRVFVLITLKSGEKIWSDPRIVHL